MRAVFSLIVIVIVAAIVLSLAKRQLGGLQRPAAGALAASAPGPQTSAAPAALPNPQAVGQQVQASIDEAARRSAEAVSAASP